MIYFYVNKNFFEAFSHIFYLIDKMIFYVDLWFFFFKICMHFLKNHPLLYKDWIVENDFAIDLEHL